MNRSDIVQAVRGVIVANLPEGLEEASYYKAMTTWVVPVELAPRTYNRGPLPVIALGERKQYVSLIFTGFYFMPGMRDWFDAAWKATGLPLDRGEATVRLRRLDDIAFDVIADAVARVSIDGIIAAFERTSAR